MIPGYDKIIEERIKVAQKKGYFENLRGSGQPLVLEDDRHIPEDLRMAYKILKNADCIPPEIELKKEICRTEDLLAGVTDVHTKYRLVKKLNFMIMKLNMLRPGSAEHEIPQHYAARIADKMEKG
jgi:hypothetical protein